MHMTDSDQVDTRTARGESGPAALERVHQHAVAAKKRVRIARDALKRARKRVKEAKREAKEARKIAASARKAWKKARSVAQPRPDGARSSTAHARTTRRTLRVSAAKAPRRVVHKTRTVHKQPARVTRAPSSTPPAVHQARRPAPPKTRVTAAKPVRAAPIRQPAKTTRRRVPRALESRPVRVAPIHPGVLEIPRTRH